MAQQCWKVKFFPGCKEGINDTRKTKVKSGYQDIVDLLYQSEIIMVRYFTCMCAIFSLAYCSRKY